MIRKPIGLIALGFVLGAFTMTAFHAFAAGEAKKVVVKPGAQAVAKPGAQTDGMPTAQSLGQPPAPPGVVPAKRTLKTLRGEIVDYYCYIEKGLVGEAHKACGTRCVAGDICMGLLTNDGDLYMISVNHLRAMDPLSFRNIPDPFNVCRGWIAEKVDLTGFAMERKGQRVIEIMGVKKAEGPPPAKPQ